MYYSKNSELKITLFLVNIIVIQNVNIVKIPLQESTVESLSSFYLLFVS